MRDNSKNTMMAADNVRTLSNAVVVLASSRGVTHWVVPCVRAGRFACLVTIAANADPATSLPHWHWLLAVDMTEGEVTTTAT
jgi:hypothetical protein